VISSRGPLSVQLGSRFEKNYDERVNAVVFLRRLGSLGISSIQEVDGYVGEEAKAVDSAHGDVQ
jgi:hypothetical protein